MIDVFEVLGWLNEFDVSHLTPAAQALVVMSRDVTQTDAQTQAMIRNLRALAQVSRDPLEIAEIRLHCAALQYWRGVFPRTIRLARGVLQDYRNDPHREAVVLWILGMAQWQTAENDAAYANWDNARDAFRAPLNDVSNLASTRNWYEECLLKMEIELAFKPEEILHWLNEFEPTHLTPPSVQLVAVIHERIRQRSYPNAYALMQDLQQVNRWSRELYERAEVYFECAFFSYQMGNISAAIELLRRAVVDFFPGAGLNHKHVIARCMLGAIEWMDQLTLNNADADWRSCLAQLEDLRVQADKDNNPGRKKWYADHRTILRRALSDRLPNTGTPRRNTGPVGSATPPPTPTSPSGTNGPAGSSSGGAAAQTRQDSQQTPTAVAEPEISEADRFNELLSLVGREELLAERLIEFERRYAPDSARRELIERAIERLIRDRQ